MLRRLLRLVDLSLHTDILVVFAGSIADFRVLKTQQAAEKLAAGAAVAAAAAPAGKAAPARGRAGSKSAAPRK